MKEINVNEIDRIVDPIVIDVREDYELEETGTIKGAIHIPMNEVPNRLNEITKEREIYILCRSGVRSYNVAKYLNELGYEAINLDGGIIDYKGELFK
ncbi:rhodanese-like domain-containing protein [Peptoniphilus harei]|uniref:Molybdopterin biosynthesis protein MoeB n=1 Tax=Peptoniphilus harei TaxID=54005 RepID=A0A2X1XXS4_9FIRM|nr:rhodanese-like domain-containing protein [Peptoniphilus harei]MDU5470772.1 rhodanese-like domain-containing protein [Peptoniphilus harei]MDU6098352.1 rhodanese-like domain-containing protein [Peptoniphilus harei]QQT90718.1 rhodanese-like domain-containing protein [Peptoniphilus harei]SPY48328.1 molybdopterin biosynthesis protein MoeB [Peptoniphilus harei]